MFVPAGSLGVTHLSFRKLSRTLAPVHPLGALNDIHDTGTQALAEAGVETNA